MNVIGIQGCYSGIEREFIPNLPRWFFHDAAAVLVADGRVEVGVEEERLNRLKHTNKFPEKAIRSCLDTRGIDLSEVKAIAVPWTEEFADEELMLQYIEHPSVPLKGARELIASRLNIPGAKIHFVDHHKAHAYSAFYDSGFGDALVIIVDGQAERHAISIYQADADGIRLLKQYPISSSLGFYYRAATKLLGYSLFDEYKVMGLAPYGSRGEYLRDLDRLLILQPNGEFTLNIEALSSSFLRNSGYLPRRKSDPFAEKDHHLAAGVQTILEKVMLHVASYWQSKTNAKYVCLAGGVAHNCAANGVLARTGLFKRVFVHPSSHDAGAAAGAALAVSSETFGLPLAKKRIENVFLGADIGSDARIEEELVKWSNVLAFRKSDSIYEEAASLLARDEVIGWVQGRSEFGPRALGHRSIIADPRPASNKDRINAMVKKREAYRPFAPAVTEEDVHDYFDLGEGAASLDYEFMTVVGLVRDTKREVLGATTHVDGTARVQTVNAERNPHFWRLIKAFECRTGTPVLLNTSFNNHAEPMVDSVVDAIQSFLTTKLDTLVVGNWIVKKRASLQDVIPTYEITVPSYMRLEERVAFSKDGDRELEYGVYREVNEGKWYPLSEEMYHGLREHTSDVTLGDILNKADEIVRERLLDEAFSLWQDRVISLKPRG